MSQNSQLKRITHSQLVAQGKVTNLKFRINRSASVNETLEEVTDRKIDSVDLLVYTNTSVQPLAFGLDKEEIELIKTMVEEVLDQIKKGEEQ